MRKLIGLMTLMAVLGALAVSASSAAAAEVTSADGTTTKEVTLADGTQAKEVTLVDGTKAIIEPTNKIQISPQDQTQCSYATVCAWESNNWSGNFSWWSSTDTGCHSHASNPKIRSGVNKTGWNVYYGTLKVPPMEGFFIFQGGNPITGQVCFPA